MENEKFDEKLQVSLAEKYLNIKEKIKALAARLSEENDSLKHQLQMLEEDAKKYELEMRKNQQKKPSKGD